jgi:hypothetical protein
MELIWHNTPSPPNIATFDANAWGIPAAPLCSLAQPFRGADQQNGYGIGGKLDRCAPLIGTGYLR